TAAVGVSTWSLFLAAVDAAASLLNTVLVPVLERLAGWMERNEGAVTALVGAFTAWKIGRFGLGVIDRAKGMASSLLSAKDRVVEFAGALRDGGSKFAGFFKAGGGLD